MITDDVKTRLYDRKVLSLTEVKDRFLDYLDAGNRSILARMFSADGAFNAQVQVTAAATNNQVDIAHAAAFSATDGLGNLIGAAADDARLQAIAIPPDAAAVYHVGLRTALVESGVERNPQTGDVEYSSITEEIGFLGTPNSVAAQGDGLRIVVNSLTESGYDYSGRSVRVWLKPKQDGGAVGPQSIDPSVAIETATVVFSTPNNYIDTVGTLGQTTISTTAADYIVMLVGPRVTRLAAQSLITEAGTVFLAAVTSVATGNPITVIDHTGQAVFSDVMSIVQDFIEIVGTRPKIRVQAYSGEADVPQITVMDPNGSTRKFTVDEDGDVYVAGNLTVAGTETVAITEAVSGSVEIGDDCATKTATFWADIIMKKGLKAGGGTGYGDIWLGDGSEATPGNTIVLDGTTCDITIGALAAGSANHLKIQRNDAIGTASAVVIQNAGAGSAMGLTVQGDVTIGISPGATSPVLGIACSTNTWSLYNSAGGLNFLVNDATDRGVTFSNAGAGNANVSADGWARFGGEVVCYGAAPRIRAEAAALLLDDVNITPADGIPLSSATEPGGQGLGTSAQSILGAIAEIQAISNNIRQGGVFNLVGLTATDQGSRVCRIAAGSAWVEGKKYIFTGNTDLTIPVSSTAYVYVTAAGAIAQTATKATAFAVDTLPLAVVTTNGSAITLIEGVRPGVPRVTQKVSVTVGKAIADNRVCDFATLGEAFRWVKHWQSQIDTLGRPEVEIVVVGQVDCTGEVITIEPEHSGLIVRGARMGDLSTFADASGYQSAFGESRIVWGFADSGVNKLFKVTNASENVGSIAFRDLVFVLSADSGTNSLFNVEGSALPMRELNFDRCRFTYDTGSATTLETVVTVASGRVVDCLSMERCRILRPGPTAAAVSIVGTVNRGRFTDCSVLNSAVNIAGVGLLLAGNWIVEKSTFSNLGTSVKTAAATILKLDKCDFSGTITYCLWGAASGNHSVTNNRATVTGPETVDVAVFRVEGGTQKYTDNEIVTAGGALGYFRGIWAGGSDAGTRIASNRIEINDDGTTVVIGIDNSTPNAAIVGNTVHPVASVGAEAGSTSINNTGANCAVCGNTCKGLPTLYSIISTGNYCNVQGNVTDEAVSVSGTGSISTGGGNVTF